MGGKHLVLSLLACVSVHVCMAQRSHYMEGTFFRAIGYEADGTTETGGESVPGTPPPGLRYEMECINPVPPATTSTCRFQWPDSPPSWCPANVHCFAVVTPVEQGQATFSHSDSLQSAINDRSVSVTVDSSQGLQTPEGEDPILLTIYNIQVLSFVDADDLQVCFRAGTLPERCVEYVLGREPDWVHVRTENTMQFQPELTERGFPYQSTVIFVRAHDFNRRDNVTIRLIAEHNGTNPSPTSNLVFPIEESDNNLEAAAFRWTGPALCVDPTATPGFCPSGVWERIGALKPKFADLTYNATFGAYDDESTDLHDAAARGVAKIRNDITSPSWLDNITSNRAGVPVGSPLQGQYVGAEASTEEGQELTRARAYVNCLVRASLYALAGPNPDAVIGDPVLVSARPPGMAVSHSDEALTLAAIGQNRGNAGLFDVDANQGRTVKRTDVQWIPQQGQEGQEYTVCMEAALGASTNTRCFVIAVARCRYCAASGDTLSSIAARFHTSWLQLWSANGARNLAVTPGTLLVLGPTYTAKPLDSLDSLATRFHTDVEKLLLLNPDIADPAVIPVGHEICFLPDICPAA